MVVVVMMVVVIMVGAVKIVESLLLCRSPSLFS